jgi:hypothetical protein
VTVNDRWLRFGGKRPQSLSLPEHPADRGWAHASTL